MLMLLSQTCLFNPLYLGYIFDGQLLASYYPPVCQMPAVPPVSPNTLKYDAEGR